MRSKLKPKQTYILIFAILGGIIVYFFISTFALLVNPYYNEDVRAILKINMQKSVSGLIAIILLFLVLHYLNVHKLVSKKVFYILFLPLCYIDAFIWIFLLGLSNLIFRSEALEFGSAYFIKAFSFLYVVIAFSGLYFLIHHWLSLKKQKEMTREATNLANEAQLQMLRYQVNPHFLFNALNTIRSMVIEDKDIARNMITKLSDFFRYSLSQNGKTDTFENEINAIKNYLEIQKTRFEEKLIVEYDIDMNLYQLKIPFFIILPLVENAIKFGLQSGKAPLKIKIIARAGDDLEISVYNTGKIVECDKSDEGTKTGIENTRKRLSLYFPGQHSFKLFEDDPWVVAQINILDYKNLLQV